jgi:hypothetical protein
MKTALVLILLLVPLTLWAGEVQTFDEPGVFSVQSPEEGYQWKKVQESVSGGVLGQVYACSKDGSRTEIVLLVQKRKADIEGSRRSVIKAHFNSTYNACRNSNFAFIETQRPPLESPIPDQVGYHLKLKAPNGKVIFLYGLTIFGQNIFSFQVQGPSAEEAKKVLDLAVKSLKEPPVSDPKKDKTLEGKSIEDPGLFSIQAPAEGFIWKKQGVSDYNNKINGYICASKDKKTILLLTVIENKAVSDQTKREIITSTFDSRQSDLENFGYSIIESNRPDLEVPIQERVTGSIKSKSPKGEILSHQYFFEFHNLTYIFEATGPENEDPKKLSEDCLLTLKELKK